MYKKRGFTIVEVSILFVIFLIVALLLIPFYVDDTMQARNIARWRKVQPEFINLLYSVSLKQYDENKSFKQAFYDIIQENVKSDIKNYKITFLNGKNNNDEYVFSNFKLTNANSVLAVKLFEKSKDNLYGYLMYDVNGVDKPNTWGKDVFGFNIYKDKIEPFGHQQSLEEQKWDCSKSGTGLSCSNYYISGGEFDL